MPQTHRCTNHQHHHNHHHDQDSGSVNGATKKKCAYDLRTIMGALGIIANVIGHTGGITATIESFISNADQREDGFFAMPLLPVTLIAFVVSLTIDLMATWVHAKIDQSNQSHKEMRVAGEGVMLDEQAALIQGEELTRWQKLCVIADMLGHILDVFSALALTVAVIKPSGLFTKVACYGISAIYATATNLSAYRSCTEQFKKALAQNTGDLSLPVILSPAP
jgi:hypothetical protein